MNSKAMPAQEQRQQLGRETHMSPEPEYTPFYTGSGKLKGVHGGGKLGHGASAYC